ncbi:MAG TPA: matrixin family metalloprotease [Acidimicrobiales bacterium]|nr:matrixin family metalloprotease [Acidimicrobiales bacterium]
MNPNTNRIVRTAAVVAAVLMAIPAGVSAAEAASSSVVEASAPAKARKVATRRAARPRKVCTGRGRARRCVIVRPGAPAPIVPAPAAAPAPVPAAASAAIAPGGGDGGAFGFLFPNGANPGRWNPCVAVHYSVNASKAPAGGEADLQEAIRRLGGATGINFVYDGPTAAVPNNGDSSAATVIAWAAPGESNMLTGSAAGIGGASGIQTGGYIRLTKGFVVIDSTRAVAPGFGGGVTQGALLMHELGHMVGLNHSADQAQIMYPTVTERTPSDWGAGDRNGLTQVGATKGCLG